MNIAYLIWVESLNNPIIRGQAIEILQELCGKLKKDKIYIIFFQAIYPFSRRINLNNLKEELKTKDIHLIIIPVIYSEWWFFAKWHQLPLIFIQAFPVLFYLSIAKNIRLFHCRSYPITLPAVAIKKLRNLRVIFDPRSDFPEENVTAGKWKVNSLSFKIWKLLEKIYLRNADATIAIAKTYIGHFKNIYKNTEPFLVPNNVNIKKFKRDDDFRYHFRLQNNIKENEILFCYCGTLGKHWNNPETYAKYIIKFRNIDMPHRFFFITPNIGILKNIFKQYNIEPEKYIIIHSKFEDVPKYLSIGDIGMVVMDKFRIAMAIKTVEYLAIGMPVITNSNLAGAREVVEENNVGLIYNLNDDIKKINKFISLYNKNRKQYILRCREVARKLFSNESVADRYAELYQKLLKNYE